MTNLSESFQTICIGYRGIGADGTYVDVLCSDGPLNVTPPHSEWKCATESQTQRGDSNTANDDRRSTFDDDGTQRVETLEEMADKMFDEEIANAVLEKGFATPILMDGDTCEGDCVAHLVVQSLTWALPASPLLPSLPPYIIHVLHPSLPSLSLSPSLPPSLAPFPTPTYFKQALERHSVVDKSSMIHD